MLFALLQPAQSYTALGKVGKERLVTALENCFLGMLEKFDSRWKKGARPFCTDLWLQRLRQELMRHSAVTLGRIGHLCGRTREGAPPGSLPSLSSGAVAERPEGGSQS